MPLILFRPSLVISKKRRIIIFTSSCAFKYVLDIPGKEMNSSFVCTSQTFGLLTEFALQTRQRIQLYTSLFFSFS